MKPIYRLVGALVAAAIVVACDDQGAQSPQNSTGDPPGVSTVSGTMGSASPSASPSVPSADH